MEFSYETIREYLKKVEERRPVVQCITNIVTVNDCANALLAVGASPTMAHHPDEMADFAAICDSLVCNMGATESLEAMMKAGILAREAAHPIVVDPVGCAGSEYRRKKCLTLISLVSPACIRGNAGEIRALANNCNTGRGVDDREEVESRNTSDRTDEHVIEKIKNDVSLLAKKTGAIVIASGKVDIIGKGTDIAEIHGGSGLLSRITGSGCMLSSLLGAFLAVDNTLKSAAACCAFMSACGERAERAALDAGKGTGTFHIALIDAMSSF